MADPMTGPAPHCQWCSAALPAADVPVCPSCGATLTSTSGTEADIKGVTTLDTEAILRARSEVARPRSRLFSFITGEAPPETAGPPSAESLARPDDAVRREMLRLQLEAERADLEAEAVAMKTEVVVEQGINLAEMDDASDAAPALAAPDALPSAGVVTADVAAADAAPGAATAAEPAGSEPAPDSPGLASPPPPPA
jgi:hypothetical protein